MRLTIIAIASIFLSACSSFEAEVRALPESEHKKRGQALIERDPVADARYVYDSGFRVLVMGYGGVTTVVGVDEPFQATYARQRFNYLRSLKTDDEKIVKIRSLLEDPAGHPVIFGPPLISERAVYQKCRSRYGTRFNRETIRLNQYSGEQVAAGQSATAK